MNKNTAYPVSFMIPLFVAVIYGIPAQLAILPVLLLDSIPLKGVFLFLLPVIYACAFVAVSALLSFPFQGAIIAGKFPRALKDVVYGPRRLYGLCWGAVFYFTPIYYLFFSIPAFRNVLLRSFGYRGHPDASIAPDVWLRDLPLLRFEKDAYIANKSTVGTNICLSDGSVLVGPITLKEKAMVGHMTMLAPGCTVAERAEIGVGCGIGIRVQIGPDSRIGPTSTVNHGARIGSKVDIGTFSYVGVKCEIGDGIKLPAGSNIPEGARILTQEEAHEYISSETRAFQSESAKLRGLYAVRRTDERRATVASEDAPVRSE